MYIGVTKVAPPLQGISVDVFCCRIDCLGTKAAQSVLNILATDVKA